MLHIVFLVLKIVGIILTALFVLLLIAMNIVCFVPLRYVVFAKASGDVRSLEIEGRFSWFFRMFSGEFSYHNKIFKSHIRILWRDRKTKKKANENKQVPQTEKMSFLQKLKFTFGKICDMIRTCRENRETFTEFISDESHLTAWKRLVQEVTRAIRYIRPRRIHGQVTFGFDDPSVTGKTLAVLSMLYPFYGDNIQITPDFEKQILDGQVHVHGKVRGLYAFVIAKNLFLDKDFKKTIKDIQAWKG